MASSALTKVKEMPLFFDDFFKPWNDWFTNGGTFFNRMLTVPAVNITQEKDNFLVSMAVPGMKKDDFKIDIDGDLLTISAEKEERKEELENKFTRREFSFTSFTRTFTLPMQVNKDKIMARYEDGILQLTIPVKEELKKLTAKHIAVQ